MIEIQRTVLNSSLNYITAFVNENKITYYLKEYRFTNIPRLNYYLTAYVLIKMKLFLNRVGENTFEIKSINLIALDGTKLMGITLKLVGLRTST